MKQFLLILCLTTTISAIGKLDASSLECQLFGDAGCKVYCNMVCDLFYCEPETPSCTETNTCTCNEKYLMRNNKKVTATEYRNLPVEDLLHHKFESSSISQRLLQMLQQDNHQNGIFKSDLQDPRESASLVRSRLLETNQLYANDFYIETAALKPRTQQTGTIHKYFIELPGLHPTKHRSYLFETVCFDKDVKDLARKFAAISSTKVKRNKYTVGVDKLLRQLTNANDLSKVMKHSNTISSCSLVQTINKQLAGKYKLTELHLSILTEEKQDTDYMDYAYVQEYSLGYKPSDIDDVILINAVMELFKAYTAAQSLTSDNGQTEFKVKIANHADGAKVQSWRADQVDGFISQTRFKHFRKQWTNGNEKLRISHERGDKTELTWEIPSKEIKIRFTMSSSSEIRREWIVKENRIYSAELPTKSTSFLWETKDLEVGMVSRKDGSSSFQCSYGPVSVQLSKLASGELLQTWKFKKVRINKDKLKNSPKEENWYFDDNFGNSVVVAEGKKTTDVDLFKKNENKYNNYMLKFCETIKSEYNKNDCLI